MSEDCDHITLWAYSLEDRTFWSWSCSCGQTLAEDGGDPAALSSAAEAFHDLRHAHGTPGDE